MKRPLSKVVSWTLKWTWFWWSKENQSFVFCLCFCLNEEPLWAPRKNFNSIEYYSIESTLIKHCWQVVCSSPDLYPVNIRLHLPSLTLKSTKFFSQPQLSTGIFQESYFRPRMVNHFCSFEVGFHLWNIWQTSCWSTAWLQSMHMWRIATSLTSPVDSLSFSLLLSQNSPLKTLHCSKKLKKVDQKKREWKVWKIAALVTVLLAAMLSATKLGLN